MSSRRLLLAAAVSLTLGGPGGLVLAATSQLTIHYRQSSGQGELTVSCPLARRVTTRTLDGQPRRLVVDIEGATLSERLQQAARAIKGDEFLSGVRVGQFRPDVVRVVADLRPGVSARGAGSTARTTVTLTRAGGAARAPAPAKQAPAQPAPAKPAPARPASAKPKAGARETIIVVIDPGHGGADPGAIGKRWRTREKDVALAISKLLAERVNRTSGMRAILTRSTDVFLPLGTRAGKAVSANAHLFVSIHADAWTEPKAHGASVFTLSQNGASSLQARWLAQTQNRSDEIGGTDFSKIPKQARGTAVDLLSEAKLLAGRQIGYAVLSEMKRFESLHKDQVESAEFAVLKAQGVPSILIESGFLSNPQDENRLRSAQHQARVANAIHQGIVRAVSEYPSYFVPKS